VRAKAEIERLKGELQRVTASPASIPTIHQETLPLLDAIAVSTNSPGQKDNVGNDDDTAPLEKSEVLNASQNENESLENGLKIDPLLDLSLLSIDNLRKMASERGVKYYKKFTKPDLVEQLKPFQDFSQ
jgi:hypothetical protein